MRRIGVVALAVSLAAVPWLRADTLNVAADAQTSSAQPNFKFGVFPLMTVRGAPSGPILNSYARFDFSALPEAPTVDKAVLRLWVGLVLTPGTIEVVPVLEPWQETTITAGSSPPVGSPITSFAVGSGDFLQYIDVDITALAQDWASGSLANNGLALRGVSPGSVNVVLDTKESFLTSHAPELEVALASSGASGPHAAPPCFDNANRYVDCNNGTVTDTVTGLIWLKDANCFGQKTYAEANQAAAGLAASQCGLTDGSAPGDWRLPTKAEWEATIARAVALGCRSGSPGGPPSLTNDPGTGCLSAGPTSFTGVPSVNPIYWSSSAPEVTPVNAWLAELTGGGVDTVFKGAAFLLWPVRGGQ